MRKPSNNSNITVTAKTHERLKRIRDHNGWTYTETINRLCELYFRDNKVEFIVNYELHFQEVKNNQLFEKIYPFKVIFNNDSFVVEYTKEDRNVTYNINEWGISESIKNTFYEFIKKDCARCLLLHMPMGLLFDSFEVYKGTVHF